ncbi:hypothetical protein C5167_014160 [Papaver somniferum]|uniref:Uncharacterized protein n=1 Tax=Papaver somniferum TaxID=3469 RepID=A0A4Y7J3A7_PAPSO|nr:hypothetical protein C5167_014160 [Papaver somniferum]
MKDLFASLPTSLFFPPNVHRAAASTGLTGTGFPIIERANVDNLTSGQFAKRKAAPDLWTYFQRRSYRMLPQELIFSVQVRGSLTVAGAQVLGDITCCIY